MAEAREKFHKERMTGIGGSDAAAVLGLLPYGKTPLELYLEKTGAIPPDDLSDSEVVHWGNVLEPVIAKEFGTREGVKILGGNPFRRHAKHKHMICHVDRIFEREDGVGGVLECKNGGIWKKEDWEPEPPLLFQVQLQHNLAVSGYQHGALAVLIGGNRFHSVMIERDDEFIEDVLVPAEADFWRRIQENDPPEPTAEDAKALSLLYNVPTEEIIQLPNVAIEWDQRMTEIKEELKSLKGQEEDLRVKLMQEMGNAVVGVLPGGGRWTWKPQTRETFRPTPELKADHPECMSKKTFRVLRRCK